MCRFALYIGEPIRIGSLVTDPEFSILNQSYHSQEGKEPLNGDGYGVAWYVDGHHTPALLKEVQPAWNSMNLRSIAAVTYSDCLLAHVRAATPGLPVTQLNCHPFQWERLTFMHNGAVGGFRRLKHRFAHELGEEAYLRIEGSADTEYVFAFAQESWLAAEDVADPLDRLETALRGAMERVEALGASAGVTEGSSLNLALCDGNHAVVSRYATPGTDAKLNSLYVRTAREFACLQGHLVSEGLAEEATIVASEPLTADEGWLRVPENHFVRMGRGRGYECVPANVCLPS